TKNNLKKKKQRIINKLLSASSKNIKNASTINTKDIKDKLRIQYSINKDLFDVLLKDYSMKTTKKILKSFMEIDDFIIKTNLLKISREKLMEKLINKHFNVINNPNVNFEKKEKNLHVILDITEFKKGFFLVQNTGSIIVSEALNPNKDSLVLDMCAAPGSKTCNLSEIMENTGTIYANDIYSSRIKSIHENAERLGCY